MATNRKAARQQRLRGAQTREPQDVDFAFTIPALPALASRTTKSEATPKSARPARVVPTRAGGWVGSTSSRRSSSATKRATPKTQGEDRAEKRQRINNHNNNAQNRDDMADRSATLGIGDQADEMRRPPPTAVARTPEPEAIGQTSSQMPMARLGVGEEVTESPMNAPGSGRRQPLSSDPAQRMADTPTKPSTRAIETDPTPKNASRRRMKGGFRQMHTVASPEFDDTQGTATTATPRAKKLREEEGDIDELSPDQPKKVRAGELHSADEGYEEEASEISDVEAAKQLTSRRRRRSGHLGKELRRESDIPDAEAEVATTSTQRARGQDAHKSLSSKRVPTKASPAQQRAPKTRPAAPAISKPSSKSRHSKTTTSAPKMRPSRVASKNVVPVTAYRMTRHVTGSDSEDDVLNRAIPFASRSTVNAVDVLAQACDEFSGSALEALSQGAARAEDESSVAERREYRTKLRAVEAFGEEVRWRLMDLTINLDAEYALRKRVRAVMKEKGELRAELMQLKAEREKVALMMDTARIQHEEDGKKNETLTTLSTTLHDVALAVSLGRDNAVSDRSLTDPPLPIVLGQVAALATNKSKEGGLLRRLKEFNGFLERVASAAEGR